MGENLWPTFSRLSLETIFPFIGQNVKRGCKGGSHEFLSPLRSMTGAFLLPQDYQRHSVSCHPRL